jgi:hypothetical protein
MACNLSERRLLINDFAEALPLSTAILQKSCRRKGGTAASWVSK